MRVIRFTNSAAAPAVISWKCDRSSAVRGVGATGVTTFCFGLKPDQTTTEPAAPGVTGAAELWEFANWATGLQLNIPLEENQVIYCATTAQKGSVYLCLEDAEA